MRARPAPGGPRRVSAPAWAFPPTPPLNLGEVVEHLEEARN